MSSYPFIQTDIVSTGYLCSLTVVKASIDWYPLKVDIPISLRICTDISKSVFGLCLAGFEVMFKDLKELND